MSPAGSNAPGRSADWSNVREHLRAAGLRWTPQRRTLVQVLSQASGHVTGSELIERCRHLDPTTIPSTVYRTLDVLEGLGLLSHSHGADGREEFHVLPVAAHGHLHCSGCGTTWEIPDEEAAAVVDSLRRSRRFAVDVTHLSIAGRCEACSARTSPAVVPGGAGSSRQSPAGTPRTLKPPST
jgi:Fur family ferric uptake transcriptional regulator